MFRGTIDPVHRRLVYSTLRIQGLWGAREQCALRCHLRSDNYCDLDVVLAANAALVSSLCLLDQRSTLSGRGTEQEQRML